MNYDDIMIYWNFNEKLICRRKKWQEFADMQRDPPNHFRICSDHFEPKCIRKKYPRPLLVHGAIPTIKPHQKSSFAPVIKCHKDKVEIYRPALEGNLSRKYSFSKSINHLGVFFKLACNPKNMPSICRQFVIEAKIFNTSGKNCFLLIFLHNKTYIL